MVEDTDFRTALDETGARDVDYAARPAPPPEPTTVRREEVVEDRPAERPGFSVAAGFYGWAVAMWFTLLFTGLVLAFLGSAAYGNATVTSSSVAFSQTTLNNLTTTGIVAGVIALFLAFFLGGYAAGRIGRWFGVWHGVAVVGWTVLFSILGAVLGYYATTTSVNVGAYLSAYAIDWNAVTTGTIVTLLVMLVVMLVGASLGGALGDNLYAREVGYERRAYTTRGGWRGRPRV